MSEYASKTDAVLGCLGKTSIALLVIIVIGFGLIVGMCGNF